jgi:hypothetical protein
MGHQIVKLIPMLQAAAPSIDSQNQNNTTSDNTLFFHWQYHPSDINKNVMIYI